jgi:hypothetical protein
MMQQMGGNKLAKRKAKKAKKAKKGKKGGGRVTAKGPVQLDKKAFALPTLEEMEAQLPNRAGSSGSENLP